MNNKNDRKLIVLSILVAVIMWAFVMTSTNPSLSRSNAKRWLCLGW